MKLLTSGLSDYGEIYDFCATGSGLNGSYMGTEILTRCMIVPGHTRFMSHGYFKYLQLLRTAMIATFWY